MTREAGIGERRVLPVGTRIGDGDRYEIRRRVGHGAMAEVYQAVDRRLNGRIVAVKTLSSAIEHHPFRDRMRALFIEEALALSRVRDDNVVAVLDSGTAVDGTPYMVMEYLTGHDLAGLLKEQGQLSVERAVEIMLAVCAGVHGCHLAGIIHRDLKPANVFLDQTPKGEQPKVLDFSVAKVPVSRDQTQTDLIVGTPNYMSPEQALGRPADERSDQYSVGALLYRCLTGRPPKGLLSSPRENRPDIPEALERVLLRAMDPIPGSRFSTVHEFGQNLVPFAAPAVRARWEGYYGSVPVAVRAIATGPVVLPDGTDATKAVAYDFEVHERTTNTVAPPTAAEGTGLDGVGADELSGASTAAEEPATMSAVRPTGIGPGISSLALASTAMAPTVNDGARSTGPGSATPLPLWRSHRGRYLVGAAVVGGIVLVGVVGGFRFRARPSPQPPSPPAWTRTVPPEPSAQRGPTIVHAVPAPAERPSTARDATQNAAGPATDESGRKRGTAARPKVERDRSAHGRRPWKRAVDGAEDTSQYPAVGNTSESSYPAMP